MPESPKEEIGRRLAEYPKEALPFFNAGFVAASKLSEETLNLFLKEVIVGLKRGLRRLNGAELRPITKLSERETEQLASVYSLIIGVLSESAATADDFVSSAKGILFLPEQEAIAKTIANSICTSRQEINISIQRAQLAGEVLPSLDAFDIAVDVRIRVVGGEVKTFVPVAVIRINTDADDNLWLQLSTGDIENIIGKLSKSLQEMKFAESLTMRKS
jgi:hypothetical protein